MRRAVSFAATLCVLAGFVPAAGANTLPSATPQETTAPSAARPRPRSTAVSPPVAERLLLANRYLEHERADDALSVVDRLVSVRKLSDVDRAQIHRFRGYILVAKGDSAQAGAEFEKALEAGALDAVAEQSMTYSLAQLYTQAGNYDRARALLDRWFETAEDPKPEAWFLKAMILVQQEAFAAALEPARTAVERSPQPREGWLQLLAAIEFQLQDYASLADTLRRLVIVAPGTKRYWVQLATIENTLGWEEDAMASLAIAHEAGLLREDREIRQRARMCFVNDIPDCCVTALEDGMKSGLVKEDAESWRLLANCLIASRQVDRAVAPLARAAELGDGARSWLLLGQLQLQRERFDGARSALQKALASVPPEQRPLVELLLGVAHLGSRHYDEAEQAFKVALANDKTRMAADSYLRHLQQQREIEKLRDSAQAGTGDGDEPVSAHTTTSASRAM